MSGGFCTSGVRKGLKNNGIYSMTDSRQQNASDSLFPKLSSAIWLNRQSHKTEKKTLLLCYIDGTITHELGIVVRPSNPKKLNF